MQEKRIFVNGKFVALIAALCCLLWGSAYPAVKNGYILFNIVSKDIPSKLVFAGYRFTIAGLILLIIAGMRGNNVLKLSKSNISNLLALGLIQTTIQYTFFYIGLANTTGVKSSIMNSTATFFSVILAHYLYKNDKLTGNKIIGCVIGFIGVMLVNFGQGIFDFSFSFMGEGLIIMSSLAFSLAAIYAKKITESLNVILVTGCSLFIGGIVLVSLGSFTGGRVYHFTVASSSILIYLAILSATAFSLWNQLLKYNKVSKISIYNFLTPIFGVILSSIFLDENILELKNLVALILVCLGIWSVNKI